MGNFLTDRVRNTLSHLYDERRDGGPIICSTSPLREGGLRGPHEIRISWGKIKGVRCH